MVVRLERRVLWDVGNPVDIGVHTMDHVCALTGYGLGPGDWATLVPDLPYRDFCAA